MSFLLNFKDTRFLNTSRNVYEEVLRRDLRYGSTLDEQKKRQLYEDITYCLSYLFISAYFEDKIIFSSYTNWMIRRQWSLVKGLNRDNIVETLIWQYRVMIYTIEENRGKSLNENEVYKLAEYLNMGIDIITGTDLDITWMENDDFFKGKYKESRSRYLQALLSNDTRRAHEVIADIRKKGLDIADVYEEVLAKTMYKVGELWHKNIITVDKEHYMTSVTQTIMSRFYDEIFFQPRNDKVLVACSVGSELHEIGIRMVSDLFEYNGWDTYYLGSALPKENILKAIDEYRPDLLALSVTMPPHLGECEETVKAIKEKDPTLAVAVGGQAFKSTDRLWEKWQVDCYSSTATELFKWAKYRF